ncbi:glycoside hydrolase family 2 protein [Pedobacter insulae]|nr:glycoside hydrolase family 2 TIM barrel-domain containing protein [Pedobacter insulae]
MINRKYFLQFLLFVSIIINFKQVLANSADNGRQSFSLNDNWKFYFAYNFEQNIDKQTVNLPHTWNAGETLKGVANYSRTTAIYENTLLIKPEWNGKRLFIYFEGVNSVATVFINKKIAGEHFGGYTGFCVEITNLVKPGENSISVQVSNAYRTDVIPLHGDFNIYGGIHRKVSLLVTNANCISPLDYGSSGVYIQQEQVSAQNASIEVLSKLAVQSTQGLSLQTTVYDQQKRKVASLKTALSTATTSSLKQQLTIDQPTLWNGKANPYLYSVEVSLLHNNEIIDQVTQPLGLRYFKVDADKGFFLNGQYLDLYGVGRHEDVAGKGSALTDTDQANDMDLIKTLGATAVRLTHYPHNKQFYDLCDKNGLVVWSEIPFVGPGGYTGTGYIKSKTLESNVKTMLLEMIRQNYNHPSVCFWGLFNELKLDYDDPQPFIEELNALAKDEDPGRLTTLASNLEKNTFTNLTDLMGWNQYFGWYGGLFSDVGNWADATHAALPKKPISISEYGAGASPFKHTETQDKVAPKGKFHPEEYQTAFHEAHWAALKKRPFIWGKFIWVLADFGSSIRTEGDQDGMNDKGLVTYDRTIKKDAFYFYKANWNPEPILYLAERRNTNRTKTITTVKVFSNAANAQLWINDKLIGKKAKNDLNTILWEKVKLAPGLNKIVVKAEIKGKALVDSCEWTVN